MHKIVVDESARCEFDAYNQFQALFLNLVMNIKRGG